MQQIIVGYTTKVRDPKTVYDHVPPPTPPGNYKKEESKQKWLEENAEAIQAQWERRAAWSKATGKIDKIYAVDIARGDTFEARDGDGDKSAGAQFYLWLRDTCGIRFPGTLLSGTALSGEALTRSAVFYGFDVRVAFRLAGMNAIRDGLVVPIRFWYQNPNCYDPKEMLLETEVKNTIPLAKLLAEAPGGPIKVPDGYVPHVDPKQDANLTAELCVRYRLMAPMTDNELVIPIEDQDAKTPAKQEKSEKAEKPKETDQPKAVEETAAAPVDTKKKSTRRKRSKATT